MIVVLDTNVIVSALLSPTGPPAEIINRWEADAYQVATSPPLLTELERVLRYPRVRKVLGAPQRAVSLVQRLKHVAIVVEPQTTPNVIENDPADDRVLACAVAAGAAYIVSGDEHLLRLKQYRGITILQPAAFLAALTWEHRP
ncbi:MAG: putative toxin-antitoxin system toxin component, PIN family [Anaerolineae bacterium]